MSGVSNYNPYPPNSQGLTEVLIDLKSTMASQTVYGVAGFQALAFEAVSQGQALYSRNSDGRVGLAVANDTEEKAIVVGFAETSKPIGQLVRVLSVGVLSTSSLVPGELYFLSEATAGLITTTAPSTPGHYVTRVGEAAKSAELIIELEPPIKLS